MKVSFVIPCYNSEQTIESVVEEIREVMRDDYEIILVNDCSPDQTFRVIEKICHQYSNVLGINLSRNFGQHAAIMAGFHHVTGDIIVCMDDDGQTPPHEVYKLIHAIGEDTDVVYAEYKHKKHSRFRNFGSRINAKMTEYLIGKPQDLFVSSYFAAKKYVIDEVLKYKNSYPYIIGLVLRTTKNIKNVEVEHNERVSGNSGYTLGKLFSLWINGFTAFSVKPLRIATVMGVSFAAAGFAYALYTIIKRFVNPNVPIGWSSTMAAILIVGGCVLFMLGLIGEYIGRIYISINDSPQYVIKDIVGGEDNAKE